MQTKNHKKSYQNFITLDHLSSITVDGQNAGSVDTTIEVKMTIELLLKVLRTHNVNTQHYDKEGRKKYHFFFHRVNAASTDKC